MDLSTVSKAIAGGIVTAVIGWAAHYGWTLSPLVHDATASIALAVVTYVVGHVVVYFAPRNKPTISV